MLHFAPSHTHLVPDTPLMVAVAHAPATSVEEPHPKDTDLSDLVTETNPISR